MKISEFRKLIREEVRKVLKEASINDISDDILRTGWGYTFNVGGNLNTIIAYNSGGQKNTTPLNSLNLASVKNLAGKIGPKAVQMIQANFATKAKKMTKADLGKSNMIIVTDHNVSDPIFITQGSTTKGGLREDGDIKDPAVLAAEKAAAAADIKAKELALNNAKKKLSNTR